MHHLCLIFGVISWLHILDGEGSAADDHSIPNYFPVREGIHGNALNQDNCPEPSSWRPVTQHECGSGKHHATIRKLVAHKQEQKSH